MQSKNILFIRCHWCYCILMIFAFSACKKLVQVAEPIDTITTPDTFRDSALATSAVVEIYSDLAYGKNILRFSTGSITIDAGMSADELIPFGDGSNQFLINKLLSTNTELSSTLWSPAYFDIYMSNAVIEGLKSSTTLSTSLKNQLSGEAKFLRAYCYFYLVNLFGDVPLNLSTEWEKTSLLGKSAVELIYAQMIADLRDAQSLLYDDYSVSGGDRIRANKWAARALLSRIYLYTKDWENAEAQATEVINNTGTYSLTDDPQGAFLVNNSEAIFQLQTINPIIYATQEARKFIPTSHTKSPSFYLTSQLLKAFEPGDKRRSQWVDSTKSGGKYYYYPSKYKVRQGSAGNITEYNTPFRLAEQYLIRAEARAQRNNLADAINDLNVIRERAGLVDLSTSLTQTEVLAAVAQERRIELFAELGHRWFDLKRTGVADSVLSLIKSDWTADAKLYAIPLSEIQRDPYLTQNAGYN